MGMDIIGYTPMGDDYPRDPEEEYFRLVPLDVDDDERKWLAEAGIDLPTTVRVQVPDGRPYFRNNVWGWGPLLGYMCDHHEEFVGPYWGSNDGDGLNGHRAQRLAHEITKDLDDGTVAADGADLPPERYGARRHDPDGGVTVIEPVDVEAFVQNVRNWRDFLLVCGGFEIW